MRAFTLIFFCLLAFSSFAQRMAQQNLYIFNTTLINPAITGMSECTIFDLYGLRQWSGIEHAPSIEGFGIQKGVRFARSKKHGLGLDFVRDVNGPSGSLGGELMYSFHFKLGRSGKNWLGLGLSGMLFQNRIDESGFSPIYDPLITGAVQQELFYNASAGGVFYSENFFAGVAVYNLLPANTAISTGYGYDRYFTTLCGGFNHKKRNSIVAWKPTVYAGIGEDIVQTDLTNKVQFKNNFMLGVTIRKYWLYGQSPGQNALFLAGYEWNRWIFEYVYDLGINGMFMHQYGSHMVGLHYKICRDKYDCPTYK